MITEQSIVKMAEGLAVADLGGEAVILDSNTGRYYGLNEVGLRIFQITSEPRVVYELVAELLGEFDVQEDKLRSDVITFLDSMVDRRLVEVEDKATA
jgi:hypothetical protein